MTSWLIAPSRRFHASLSVATLLAALAIAACGSHPNPLGGTTSGDGGSAAGTGAGWTSSTTSGSGQPANLCQIDACGGDVVGAWEFASPCQSPRPAPVDDCGGGQDYFQTRVEGTIEFHPDGSDTLSTRLAQRVMSYHPVRCLPQPDTKCDQFFIGYDSCEVHEGFCDCIHDTSAPYETSEETYEHQGNTLTFIDGNGEKTAVSYCVGGGWLHYAHEGDSIPETLQKMD